MPESIEAASDESTCKRRFQCRGRGDVELKPSESGRSECGVLDLQEVAITCYQKVGVGSEGTLEENVVFGVTTET
jgi:hypothetical protein